LKKLKSLEDQSEYCLVEQIESEIQPNDTNVNTTLNSSNQNITNYNKNTTTQSTHTTGTLSTTLSSYIKTNGSSMSGGTNATSSSSNNKTVASSSSATTSKLITKTRVLNSTDNLYELTNLWSKMKLDKKDGFKQVKVILVKKKALQAPNSLNSLSSSMANKQASHHSKISASFAKVAAKSSNLHSIFSASLASANLTYFNSPHANVSTNAAALASSSSTTNQRKTTGVGSSSSSSAAAALNQNNRTKSSSNRLVRQKSFDDTYDTLANDKLKNKREINVKKQHTTSNEAAYSTTFNRKNISTPPIPPPMPLLSTLFKSKSPDQSLQTDKLTATSFSSNNEVTNVSSLKHINEINESKSKLALNTEIQAQKNNLNEEDDEEDYEDEENEFDDDENKDDYQLIQAEAFTNILNTNNEANKGEINDDNSDSQNNNQNFSPVKPDENENLEKPAQAIDSSVLNEPKIERNRSTLKRLFNIKF
jgi:hypothetical protein